MKKFLQITLVVLTAIGLIAVLTACVQKEPELETFERPMGGDDMECYYGCPGSRRVRKLNLRKKRRA